MLMDMETLRAELNKKKPKKADIPPDPTARVIDYKAWVEQRKIDQLIESYR